jgi:membrane dipeptidase
VAGELNARSQTAETGVDGVRFFDAHCDTILEVVEEGRHFQTGPGLHVTLPDLRAAGVCAQVFACFVLEARDPGRAYEHAVELVDAVHGLCVAHSSELRLARAAEDVAAACTADGPTAVILSLEGADPLQGDAEVLRDFHCRGVRLLTLAWDDNVFCGTSFGSGAGLSAEGEHLVALCEELGVMVDVSHASDAAFWDVCRVATKPFVASHSDCRALCDVGRNLTDEMIRALAERGGVMGINLASGFLSQEFADAEKGSREAFWAAVRSGEKNFDDAHEEASRASCGLPRPPLDVIAAHVLHAINVGGEDCVGLGGDLDGIDSMPAGVDGVGDYPRIADLLLRHDLTESQVEKVCYRNFARVLGG